MLGFSRLFLLVILVLLLGSGVASGHERQQKVKVSIADMIVTKSDDKGPANPADMNMINIGVSFFNSGRNGKLKLIDKQTLYNWSSSGDRTVEVGEVWKIGKSVEASFETDDRLFNFLKSAIVINGKAREYDTVLAYEDGSGELSMPIIEMLGRTTQVEITGYDFTMLVNVVMTLED